MAGHLGVKTPGDPATPLLCLTQDKNFSTAMQRQRASDCQVRGLVKVVSKFPSDPPRAATEASTVHTYPFCVKRRHQASRARIDFRIPISPSRRKCGQNFQEHHGAVAKHVSTVNQELLRKVPTAPTCENSTVFCTVRPSRRGTAGAVTAFHRNADHHTPAQNWNARHSVIELNPRHVQKHEQERLLELELHDHRGTTHSHGHDLLLDRGTTAALISIPPWPGGGTSTDQCMPAIDVSTFQVSV